MQVGRAHAQSSPDLRRKVWGRAVSLRSAGNSIEPGPQMMPNVVANLQIGLSDLNVGSGQVKCTDIIMKTQAISIMYINEFGSVCRGVDTSVSPIDTKCRR